MRQFPWLRSLRDQRVPGRRAPRPTATGAVPHGAAVLVLSQYVMERATVNLVGADISRVGYLLKYRVADRDAFVDALRRVADGGSALDPNVVSRMIVRRESDDLDRLTPRKRDLLRVMAEGRSTRGTAEQLVISEDAVERHVNNLLRTLDILGGHPTTAALALLRREPGR